jgi:hypothetical protein
VKRSVLILLCFIGSAGFSQQPTPTPPSVAAEDPGTETGQLKKNCPFKHVLGCLQVLFTGQPVHIAVGSLAPQNGFAAGLAYVGQHNNLSSNWRNSWDADTVVSPNLSWRAGFYLKLVDSRVPDVGIQHGKKGIKANPTELPEQPVINIYAQAESLNKLLFFGLGPRSSLAGRAFYGMRETIAGISAVKPLNDRIHSSLYAEANSRWVEIRPPGDNPGPTLQTSYTEATAPGLTTQPFFLQLGAGARIRPDLFKDHLILDYDLGFRPYIATNSHFTFARLTADLSHQIQIYGRGFPLPRANKGPDDCSGEPVSDPNSLEGAPPPVKVCSNQYTRDKVGTLELRAFSSLSMTPGHSVVPFYFQPTLGGGDINGTSSLSSYTDYRFRAPNVLLLRETFEHSIGKWPVGFLLSADEGKVALLRGDLGDNPWIHSFSTGLTVRAGGFPMLSVVFAWGHEGTHILANVNPSLLGSSARPSLF